MGFISAGYDGTVDEVQFANLLKRYSVVGPEDFKASTQAGDRIVAISDGTALGPGTIDVATAIPNIQFAAAAAGTTRWDLVALRRDWQPPGGASSIVIIQGGSAKDFPPEGTASTAWNRRPGIVDDQPLYLQEVNGTLLGVRVDLRVWNGGGGLYAKDDLVRSYMDEVGTDITINGIRWTRKLGDNDALGWDKRGELGKIPLLGTAGARSGNPPAGTQFFIQAGSAILPQEVNGYGTIWLPAVFPNGIVSATVANGDVAATGRGWFAALNGATKEALFANLSNGAGNGYNAGQWRCDWVAVGW